jgi:uncharacterized membrane protein YcgQ (UPF0703/DUF1980 family)
MNIFAFLIFWAASRVRTRVLVSAACIVLLSACPSKAPASILASAQSNNVGTKSVPLSMEKSEKTGKIVKLPKDGIVEIKEKMFIAQTNDVYLNADEYLGRTIKLEGLFKYEQYAGIDTAYCFVLRYGPGCCGNDGNAGFEVAWDGDAPPPYPEADAWVEAAGTLASYEEDGYPYLYISLSSLNVLEKRGAEYVTQ